MMNKIIIFLIILLIHLLYDFHWQGEFIAINKGKYLFILIIHCFTWALFIWLAGYLLISFAWWKLAFLFITHFVSDYWKSHQLKTDENFYQIYIDQSIHLTTLILVVIL